MSTRPLVTVMIATRDRAPELKRTLELLKEQQYAPLEIVVVDDGSKEVMEPVVRTLWPNAIVIRHEDSQGQCQRRNEGFAASHGEFILQLDDDCCLTKPGDLQVAVQYLSKRPKAAAVIFDLFNGPVMPDGLLPSSAVPGCVLSFVGAAILFRATAARGTAGYRSFFQGQREEEELALQLLSTGWQILYCPIILAHHRLSELNRDSLGGWRRGIRNDIWTRALHMPGHRLPIELGWTLVVGIWDMVRLARFRAFCDAIWTCVLGLRRVWRLRQPFPPMALRRYDALRLRSVLAEADFEHPPGISIIDLRRWWSRWRRRARDRSSWENGGPGTGSSHTVRYSHEFPMRQDATPMHVATPEKDRSGRSPCAAVPGGSSDKPNHGERIV